MGRSTETERRLVAATRWEKGGWEWGEAANGSGVSLESDESVLKLDYGDGCTTL